MAEAVVLVNMTILMFILSEINPETKLPIEMKKKSSRLR
jgi:hypothetical protein